MAPVQRGPKRPAAPSRRPATPPAQQRRNVAAQPAPRGRAAAAVAEAEEEEGTEFDADDTGTGAVDASADIEYDEDNLPEVLDLSGIEPASFDVLPRGWYSGTIDQVEYGLSQSSAKPMLTWSIRIEYENDEGELKEKTLRWWTTLAGEGAGRTIASLAKLDPDLDMKTFRPEDMDEHFAEMAVRVQLTIRPDRENRKLKRNNIADVVPDDEAE